jgi:plasmid stabilization system protein ParE
MEVYDVKFLQESLDDLEQIVVFIAKNSRKAALDMHDKIIGKVNELSAFPRRGRPVPDSKMSAAGFRMLGIKPYIAFYRVIGNKVFIYRVLHGASNYPVLYAKLSENLVSE